MRTYLADRLGELVELVRWLASRADRWLRRR